MKKNLLKSGILTFIIGCSSTLANAQDQSFNRWSIEGQFGVRRAFSPYAPGYYTPVIGLFHAGLGTRYMTNNKFGIQVDFGYDQFKNKSQTKGFTSNYMRASVQGVINVGNVFEFSDWSNHVSLLAHAGAGYSILTAKGSDKIDNMGHIIMGLAPQFKITERFSINLDLSMTGNILQSRTFDFTAKATKSGLEGFILTGSLGFSIYLGKNSKHADWHHPKDQWRQAIDSMKTTMGTYQEKIDSLESRVSKIETDLLDSDADGVADKFDLEPNTAPDAKVDTKGRTVKEEPVVNRQSLDAMQGLFFTVQLGVYSHEVPSEVMKNIVPLDTKTMPDGKIRYFSGVYQSQEDAAVKLEEAKKAGISDAFLTAYFRGSRITLVEARTFLQELGPGILQKR